MTRELCNELKKRREELGMRLFDVAKMTGVSTSYLSQLERGKIGCPSVNTAEHIERALRLDPGFFVKQLPPNPQEEFIPPKKKPRCVARISIDLFSDGTNFVFLNLNQGKNSEDLNIMNLCEEAISSFKRRMR